MGWEIDNLDADDWSPSGTRRGEGRRAQRERSQKGKVVGQVLGGLSCIAYLEDGADLGFQSTGDRLPDQPLSEFRSAMVLP